MNFDFKRHLYESTPLFFKRLLCKIPFEYIAGKYYRQVMSRDDFFNKASYDEINKYQEEVLGKMLNFVVEQVPAYRQFRSMVVKLRPFDAVKEFPILDKDTLQSNLNDYLPNCFDSIPHYEISTGGTSGNQLKLFVDNHSQSIETGFVHRLWKRMGYTPQKKKATFRGVMFKDLKPNCFWQFNPIYNEVQFSPFHMSEQNLPRYIEQLISYSPEYLHGYPSAIDCLSEFIIRNKIVNCCPKLKAIFLVSEGCSGSQRERIENAFKVRVFSFYGHSERVILGGECEVSEIYHSFPDYGFLEIIDDSGKVCVNPGERGEIVGTGFLNYSLPLIRYRTGDFATRCESSCECGRNWDRFTDVEGHRRQDVLISNKGVRISLAALNMHGPIFEKVSRYQYVQHKKGFFEILLVTAPDFREKDTVLIREAYKSKLKNEFDFEIKVVDEIPLTSRGKHKFIISELNDST